MDKGNYGKSLTEVKKEKGILLYTNAVCATALLIFAIAWALHSEIVVWRIPGMPDGAKIEKSGMDKGAEQAVLLLVTSAIAEINPSNYVGQKALIQPFLSPDAYTKISALIDQRVAEMKAEQALGSYYFVFSRFAYDDKLERVFVVGDVHTVNAAVDTSEKYVFEYTVHFENYQLKIDTAISYPGERIHNTDWYKAQKQK